MAEVTEKPKSTKKKVRYGTSIKKCDCKGTLATEYQDQTFGKGMRVHNYCKSGDSLRCTCCAKVS